MTIVKGKKKDRRLNEFLGEDWRGLICGQSNCGKANLLMDILRKPLVYCDQIYYYGHNPHQKKKKKYKT